MKNILVIPDIHSSPEADNKRADYLAQIIIDKKPDIVVNMGDSLDLNSLSSYDKGKRSFVGRTYRADINHHLDFQSRMWEPVRARKKKLPYKVVLHGNHENRIERVLDLSPELTGTVGFNDLDYASYYDDIVPYDGGTPGIIEIEGILFSHYFSSGVMGRAVSGDNAASILLTKLRTSCVAGHLHTFDYSVRQNLIGKASHGLVAGCYHTHKPSWAGNTSYLWRSGVCFLNNVSNGDYDLEWISIAALEKEYG